MSEVEFCGIDGARLVETDADPLIGQTIDRYRVEAVLGRGAMAAVYRARHTVLERDFAIKVLFGDLASNRSVVGRFRREAQALSRVRHSNIISVVDFGTTEQGLTFLAMDYVEGITLSELIEQQAPLPWGRAARVVRQMAAGLGEAHRLGLIHRDVKPANVLLVQEGGEEVVKLLDFGIVAIDDENTSTKLTGTGKIVGTPIYMAPEQGRPGPITAAADLYALGVILYQMLAGAPPFQGEGLAEVLLKHTLHPPPPLPPSGGLEQFAYWLLMKDPARRPSSAAALISELDQFLSARSSNPPQRAPSQFPTPLNDLISVLPTRTASSSVEAMEIPTAIPAPAPSQPPTPLSTEELKVALADTVPRLVTPSKIPASAPPPPRPASGAEIRAMAPSMLTASGNSDLPLGDLEHGLHQPRGGVLAVIGLALLGGGLLFFWDHGKEPRSVSLVGESTAKSSPPPSPRYSAEAVDPQRPATEGVTTSSKAEPPKAVVAPPADPKKPGTGVPQLERKLNRAMAKQGMNAEDLRSLASTAQLLERLNQAKAKGHDGEAVAALTTLVAEVNELEHPHWLLRAKTRRVQNLLRTASLEREKRAALDRRYRELAEKVKPKIEEVEALKLSVSLNKLEEELQRTR